MMVLWLSCGVLRELLRRVGVVAAWIRTMASTLALCLSLTAAAAAICPNSMGPTSRPVRMSRTAVWGQSQAVGCRSLPVSSSLTPMGLGLPRKLQLRGARFAAPPCALCAEPKPIEDSSSDGSDSAPPSEAAIDWLAIGKYKLAVVTQVGLIAALFRATDALVTLRAPLVWPLFFFLSLRSRIFSPLPASRPNRSAQKGNATPVETKRPSWTPPGIAFPIIWLSISVLRATSSLLVWRACGRVLFTPPLLFLILHLCTGDAWNCITNIERRLGTSAVGVLYVLASVIAAVAAYRRATPLAGALLAPSAVWLTIASVLTWTIWNINEPRQPLLPRKGDGKGAPLRLPLSNIFEK